MKNEYIKEIITDANELAQDIDLVEVSKQWKDKKGNTRLTFKDREELENTICSLKSTLREHKDGVGLAAPQIGINKQVFVINFNGDIKTYINPMIVDSKEMQLSKESCLSLPNRQFIVPRYSIIKYTATEPQGIVVEGTLFGLAAYVFQHELDHLNGVNISEVGLEIDDDFNNASEEEKEEILKVFLESIKKRATEVVNEINKDPDLKQVNDAIRFMKEKSEGKIETEKFTVPKEEIEKLKEKVKKEKKTDDRNKK